VASPAGTTGSGATPATSQPLTYDEYQSTRYFPALDGVRALAALMVLSWHMKVVAWTSLSGGKGVTIFFVLSGFLITTLALREEDARGRLALPAFYIRRIARICPVYYAVLLVHVVLIFGLSFGFSLAKREPFGAALPYYLTYMNEFGVGESGSNTPFYQSWSLGIEQKFYLLWPLLAFVLFRRIKILRLVFIVVFIVVFAALSHLGTGRRLVEYLWLTDYAAILLGCLTALALHDPRAYARLRFLGQPPWALFAALLLLAAQLLLQPYPALEGVYPCVVALFLISLVIGRTRFGRSLGSHPMVYIGTRSYGIYLVHLLALNVVELVFRPGAVPYAMSPLYFLAAALVSLAAAEVLYRLIEKPGIALGRRWSRRLLEAGEAGG